MNSVLLIGVVRKYVHFRQLQHEERMNLESVFPPLSEEQVHNYLKKLFVNLDTFEQESFQRRVKYELYYDKKLIGHAYQVKEDIFCPVCEDVRFLVGVDLQGAITGIVLVNDFHLYGEKMKPDKVQMFLSQFINRQLGDAFILDHNIKGITGATKTTRYFLEGIIGIRNVHPVRAEE